MDGIGQEEVGETFMNKRMTLPRRPWSPACRLSRVQSDPTGPLIEAYSQDNFGHSQTDGCPHAHARLSKGARLEALTRTWQIGKRHLTDFLGPYAAGCCACLPCTFDDQQTEHSRARVTLGQTKSA